MLKLLFPESFLCSPKVEGIGKNPNPRIGNTPEYDEGDQTNS